MANPIHAQAMCEPAERHQREDRVFYNVPGRLSGADRRSANPPERDRTRRCGRELRHGDADEILTVGRVDIEGEFRDMRERLEVLACQTIGVHKARDTREVLDAGVVPNEGVAYENGEVLTHLYSKSGVGDGDVRCVCDALGEPVIRKDAVSEDAHRGATREGTEAPNDAETTDGYASRDDAETCATGEGCEVGMERYERGNSPVDPERAAIRSGRQRGRRDSGRVRRGARAHAVCSISIPVSTTAWMPGWLPCVFRISDLLFFRFSVMFVVLNHWTVRVLRTCWSSDFSLFCWLFPPFLIILNVFISLFLPCF